jgi:transposase
MDLTNEQWAIIEPLIPEEERQPSGPGRPWRDGREVMNGILWILRTGARWQDLLDRYPSYQTCHRRFRQWVDLGVFDSMLQTIADDLLHRGQLDLSECFIDGTFVAAKKRASKWERPSAGTLWVKVRRSWQWQTALVFLSPFTLSLLRHMKSPLLNRLSPHVLSMSSRNG